jgi:hypothetical protein
MGKRIDQYQGVRIIYPKGKHISDTKAKRTIAEAKLKHKKPIIKVYYPNLLTKRILNHEMGHIKFGHLQTTSDGRISVVQHWANEIAAIRYAHKKEGKGLSPKEIVSYLNHANQDFNKYRKHKLSLKEFVGELKKNRYTFGLTEKEFMGAYDLIQAEDIKDA